MEREDTQQPNKRRYVAQARNGYGAIDLYEGSACIRTIIAGITQKLARQIAGDLNTAYSYGLDDAVTGTS